MDARWIFLSHWGELQGVILAFRRPGGQQLSGDSCVICPSSNWRLPQEWKACSEKITRAGGKFSSTAYFSDGKVSLSPSQNHLLERADFGKIQLKKPKKPSTTIKSPFDKLEMFFSLWTFISFKWHYGETATRSAARMGCFGCHGMGTFLDEARPKFSFEISFLWEVFK